MNQITAIIAIASALLGSGGVYAWFKLGPERKKITIEVAQGAVIIQSAVLKEIREDNLRISDELAQLKLEAVEWQHNQETNRTTIAQLKLSILYLQRDLDRHGRMAELSRRKAHAAIHLLGAFELLIDELHNELRDHQIAIKPELRPHALRAQFQAEMDKLEALESDIVTEALRSKPPNPE